MTASDNARARGDESNLGGRGEILLHVRSAESSRGSCTSRANVPLRGPTAHRVLQQLLNANDSEYWRYSSV